MADLPEERSSNAAPFSYVGMNMFGPFITKEGRKELNRYGAIFKCLASRAIHLEVVNSMDAESFIMCLRRIIGRRGNVKMVRSDNGSNFIGAEEELSKGFLEMDQNKIRKLSKNLGSDWIIWKKNPPAGSHFGGVWEHQIRSARAVLGSLLKTHGSNLNDESIETIEHIADGTSEAAISPSNLLTMKSKVVMPPPGSFGTPDL